MPYPLRRSLPIHAAAMGVAALIAAACGFSCDSGPVRKPRATEVRPTVSRDVPAVIRNTVGAQTTIQGMDAQLVSGYGLVVGLNGTGSGDVPGPIRAVMEREMALMGVGKEVGPLRDITPGEMLDDPTTAVVVVSAVVPPGAPKGTRFDIQVDALPGTATTSLEGGRLYTCKLFRGLIRPAAPATAPRAGAAGAVFINPFANPSAQGRDSVLRTTGRVLNGGVVTEPRRITLQLDAPSHSRARAIAEAINSRFPRERGAEDTAKGLNEDLVEVNIPESWRDRPDDFIQLMRRTRVDQTFPQEAALSYARALREQPELAEELSWCLQAIGPVAIPYLRELYEEPQKAPRLAAIVAGARLGDLTVRPYLEDLSVNGAPAERTRAIALLGALGQDPKINIFLRDLLNAPDFDVRVAAYEALDAQKDPWIERREVGDKFILDSVPSAEPMIYVTLQRIPRIVVFGNALEVRRPVFVSIWNDRLMLSSQTPGQKIQIFFKDFRSDQITTGEVPSPVADLITYLAHHTTPEEPAPGLNLSYSEVVGALASIIQGGAIGATFVPETDRLALELLRSRQTETGEDRPEFAEDEEKPGLTDEERAAKQAAKPSKPPSQVTQPTPSVQPMPAPPQGKKTYVVPVAPPSAPPKGSNSSGRPGTGD